MTLETSEREYYNAINLSTRNNPTLLAQVLEGDFGAKSRISTLPAFFEHLPEIKGKKGLELGCGIGWLLVEMNRRGAKMEGLDISDEGLILAKEVCKKYGIDSQSLTTGSMRRLPYRNEEYDFVVGFAVLHHLSGNLGEIALEINRILKPNSKAIFCEPLGENPILEFARSNLPYKYKSRTTGEKPLLLSDITKMRSSFSDIKLYHLSLLQMADRLVPNQKLSNILGKIDSKILSVMPGLNRYCRYVIIECTK